MPLAVPTVDSRSQHATTIPPLRIVLVEDNPDAREALRELLSLDGHIVAIAADGLAGLRAIHEHQPEVAIVDIGLPLLDGYALAERVRADPSLGRVRLLALTGYGQAKDLERARAAGFDGHVVKPVDVRALTRALAAVESIDGRNRGTSPTGKVEK